MYYAMRLLLKTATTMVHSVSCLVLRNVKLRYVLATRSWWVGVVAMCAQSTTIMHASFAD